MVPDTNRSVSAAASNPAGGDLLFEGELGQVDIVLGSGDQVDQLTDFRLEGDLDDKLDVRNDDQEPFPGDHSRRGTIPRGRHSTFLVGSAS